VATLWLEFQQDFGLNPNGGLAMAQQWDETRQAFERGMFACPAFTMQDGSQVDPDLFFDTTFGAGLGLQIGQNPTGQWVGKMTQAANQAAATAPGVNPTIPPVITLNPSGHTQQMAVTIATLTGPQTLSYQIT
jgi:hypothetical protein